MCFLKNCRPARKFLGNCVISYLLRNWIFQNFLPFGLLAEGMRGFSPNQKVVGSNGLFQKKVRNPYVEEVGFSVQGGTPRKTWKIQGGQWDFVKNPGGYLKFQQKLKGVHQELAKTSKGFIKNKRKIQRGSLKFRQKSRGVDLPKMSSSTWGVQFFSGIAQ